METAFPSADRRLALEHGATRVLAEANSVEEAAPRLIQAICEALDWQCGAWWGDGPAKDTLLCVGAWGRGGDAVDEFLRETRAMLLQSREPGGFVRRTWIGGEAVWAQDVSLEPGFRRAAVAIRAGLRSAFAFPIRAGADVIGVMEFFNSGIRQPDRELLDCMRYIGSQVGEFARRAQAERALRISEKRFRSLTALSSDWYWEQDDQFRLTYMSRRMGEKTGLDASAYLGRKRWDQPALNLTEADWERHRAQLERREPFRDFEMQRPSGDGRTVWISLSGEPVFDEAGLFKGYCGTGRDITEQKNAEAALRKSEARFRSLTELSSDWYWEQDAQFRFTQFEGSGQAGKAYSPSMTVVGKTAWELPGVLPGSIDWQAHRARLERREAFRDLEYAYRDRSGREFHVSVNGVPVYDAKGRFEGYRGTSRDITERRQRENELARFQTAMDASPDMIYITDRDSMRFVYVNETACRLTGFSREEFLRLGPADVLRSDARDVDRMFDEAIAAGAEGTVQELKSVTKDGLRTMVEVRRRAVRLDGRWLVVTIAHDISARKRAEQATARLGRMFAALSATNETILRAKSREELYQRVCEASVDGGKFRNTAIIEPVAGTGAARVAAVSGVAADAMRQAGITLDPAVPEGRGLAGTAFRTAKPCVSHDFAADERTRPWHEQTRRAGIHSGAAIPLLRGGRAVGVMLFYSGEKDAFDAEIVRLLERMAENVVFALDNFARESERRHAEEQVQYLASHDSLTGLPNRAMFGELLGHAIGTAQRYSRSFAVLFIDLDRFKMVNDTLGHQAGDELLQAVAGRLKNAVRSSDVVARLGGDEFVVLVQEVRSARQASTVARKILSAMIRPLALAGQEFRVTASIGISMYPQHAHDESGLMRCADLAMYLAKEEGKNNFQIYSTDIRSASLERMALETDLRRALEQGEFALHYQAKQDLQSGAVTGVEALLRWTSPRLGSVSPAQFIPLAEETGLIVPIGRWVLGAACAQHVTWLRQGLPPVPMAVNLSPRQFAAPDLLADIDAALARTGMRPEHLELEITEGMVMHHPERAVGILREIKKRGIRLAIDDFGTGYSSLAQLKRFPIDTLKVDRSFIRDLPHDAEDKAITEAIIAMAKTLSLTVVAEGVETAEQCAFLRDRACDQMQGYYFTRALPPEECFVLLREAKSRRNAA